MKKFMLGAMALFACGEMMAMEQALATLRARIEASAIRSAVLSESNTLGFDGEIKAEKARDTWKKVYTAHVFSQMKKGEPVSKFLVNGTININNQSGPVYEKFGYEYVKNGVYEGTGLYCCKSTLAEEMEKDWQDICTMVANGHFTLTASAPQPMEREKCFIITPEAIEASGHRELWNKLQGAAIECCWNLGPNPVFFQKAYMAYAFSSISRGMPAANFCKGGDYQKLRGYIATYASNMKEEQLDQSMRNGWQEMCQALQVAKQ
jgi:hypothetical protein